MLVVLLIGCGGFLGSVCRFLLSELAHGMFRGVSFPIGTLTVNVLGCLVIGIVAGLPESKMILDEKDRFFVMTGFLGGFTTFSAFGHDSYQLFKDGSMGTMFWNIGGNVVLGMAAVWLGYRIAKGG